MKRMRPKVISYLVYWIEAARFFGEDDSFNTGLGSFFSFSGENDEQEMEEKFGFAINASLRNINKIENKEDARKSFVISLSVSVPLRFSLQLLWSKQSK